MKRYKLIYMWLFTFVLLVFTMFTYGQNQQSDTLTSEQKRAIEEQKQLEKKYNVQRGSRPSIDLENVPEDAYKKGVLIIKLKPYMEKSFDYRYMKAGDKGYVETGIKHFDEINKAFEVQRYTRTLDALYELPNSDAVKKHRERHRAWGFHLLRKIEFKENYDVIEVVRKFEALDEVEYAEPVYKTKTNANTSLEKNNDENNNINTKSKGSNFPNDDDYDKQYALPLIDAPGAWEFEKGNPDVIVAIVDEGIQYDHEDLEENMWDPIGPDGEDTWGDDHGTHVGGIVGAVTNNDEGIAGVAGGDGTSDSGIELMSIDLVNPYGSYYKDFPEDRKNAQLWAADNGAVISQNSWNYKDANTVNEKTLDGIDYFNNHGGGNILDGGITIFSAGNEDTNEPWYPGYYGYDDKFPETHGAMAVAATDEDDKKWSDSNYGEWINISAPGRDIYSTIADNDYDNDSGTSMAAPHVSGVAALVVSAAERYNMTLDTNDVWDILVNNAECIDDLNPAYEGELGSGRLNASQALEAIFPKITGPTRVCGPTGYDIVNTEYLPSGFNVSWSWLPQSALVSTTGCDEGEHGLCVMDNEPSNNVTITANISHDDWEEDMEFSKDNIKVGAPQPPKPIVHYNPGMNSVCKGHEHTATTDGHPEATGYQWRLIYPDDFSWDLPSGSSSTTFCIDNTGWYTVGVKQKVEGFEDCGWSGEAQNSFPVEDCGTGETCKWPVPNFKVYPNPASSTLNVEATIESDSYGDTFDKNTTYQVKLYNWEDAHLTHTSGFTLQESSHQVDISHLREGKYILHITGDEEVLHKEQVIIE